VATSFSGSVPNATLEALRLNVGVAPLSCRRYVSEIPLELAVSVTVWVPLIAETVAVNPAVSAPTGTVTDAGTVTALLLLLSVTFRLVDTS
jgi:hypothetical protein